LQELHARDEIHEAVALSTCNRTELYLAVGDAVVAEGTALSHLAKHSEIAPTDLTPLLYTIHNTAVPAHLMRVAGGLDSMVLGESEILGQVKRAYELALEEHVTGPVVNRMFSQAIVAGKRIQSETGVGARHLSIAGAAVAFARHQLGDLKDRRTLVIGAGGNGELAARALSDAGARAVFVANRNYDRAIGVAHSVGGEAVRLDKLPEELVDADIVLSSTASPHTLIHPEELAQVMKQRAGRELLLLDIAVPRDIDPAVSELDGVTLLDIDDLQEDIEHSLQLRLGETTKAEAVIGQELDEFERWFSTLDVLPTVSDLRRHAEEIAGRVIAENSGRFENLSDNDRKRIDSMARAIVTRLLHEPTLRLKAASADDDGYRYAQALRELFALDAGEGSNVVSDDDASGSAEIHSLDELRSRGLDRRRETSRDDDTPPTH
ncbi:MAG: glutamyl-tRNA reductase, partial [Solirubrobacterales bacterium]